MYHASLPKFHLARMNSLFVSSTALLRDVEVSVADGNGQVGILYDLSVGGVRFAFAAFRNGPVVVAPDGFPQFFSCPRARNGSGSRDPARWSSRAQQRRKETGALVGAFVRSTC